MHVERTLPSPSAPCLSCAEIAHPDWSSFGLYRISPAAEGSHPCELAAICLTVWVHRSPYAQLVSASAGHFWDGAGGALIGAVISASIAIYVLFRTRKYDRQLFHAQQNADAARRITSAVNDLYNLVRSLRGQSPYPGTKEMKALHQAVRFVVAVTRLDIPLLNSMTMRVRIYHTRRRCEDAEEETKRVLKRVKRDYERGLITEDEARQEFIEADPLGPVASHLAALVTDLDEFRALGKVPRRVTVNPPQSRDSMTLFEWSQSKRHPTHARLTNRIVVATALAGRRARWRLGATLPWPRSSRQSSGLESLEARALAATARDDARRQRTRTERIGRERRKTSTHAASEVGRILGVQSRPDDWTVRLEWDDVGPLYRAYAQIKDVQLRCSRRLPWVEVRTDGGWSQLTLAEFGRALRAANSRPRSDASAGPTKEPGYEISELLGAFTSRQSGDGPGDVPEPDADGPGQAPVA